MTLLLWGVAIGWTAKWVYEWSQKDNSNKESVSSGALVVLIILLLCATYTSIAIGVTSGALPAQAPTPTITLGR